MVSKNSSNLKNSSVELLGRRFLGSPLFFNDSEKLLSQNDKGFSVFNLHNTGKVECKHIKCNKGKIVSLFTPNSESEKEKDSSIYLCDTKGKISFYGPNGERSQRKPLQTNLNIIKAVFSQSESAIILFALCKLPKRSERLNKNAKKVPKFSKISKNCGAQLYSVDLTHAQKDPRPMLKTGVKRPVSLLIAKENSAAVLSDRSALFFRKGLKIRRFKSANVFLCADISEGGELLATGDRKGVISLWHYEKDSKSVENASLHWHAHGVLAVKFAEQGRYLLSGGYEGVLVVWQVESGRKEFLPRLGAPLKSISVCPEGLKYGLRLGNNRVLVIDSLRNKVEHTFSDIHLDKALQDELFFIADKNKKVLAVNGLPGKLQFYGINPQIPTNELTVSAVNVISNPEEPVGKKLPYVEMAAFSKGNKWLAILEKRSLSRLPGLNFVPEEHVLRFFEKDSLSDFALHSAIVTPLSHEITNLFFHPSNEEVAFTVDSFSIKRWALTKDIKRKGENTKSHWKFEESAFGEKSCWCGKIIASEISSDGSVIATLGAKAVNFWKSENLEFVAHFAYGILNGNNILKSTIHSQLGTNILISDMFATKGEIKFVGETRVLWWHNNCIYILGLSSPNKSQKFGKSQNLENLENDSAIRRIYPLEGLEVTMSKTSERYKEGIKGEDGKEVKKINSIGTLKDSFTLVAICSWFCESEMNVYVCVLEEINGGGVIKVISIGKDISERKICKEISVPCPLVNKWSKLEIIHNKANKNKISLAYIAKEMRLVQVNFDIH